MTFWGDCMIRKKHGGKKRKTYRPKFAKKEYNKKTRSVSQPSAVEGVSVIPKLNSEMQKIQISKEQLPGSYTSVDNQAYTFPPFGYVVIMTLLIAFIAYLLF